MSRRTIAPEAPTGQPDQESPIIRDFDDGPVMGAWWEAIRTGKTPSVGVMDQLEAAGWRHIAVSRVDEIVDERRRQTIGYGAIRRILGHSKGCELEIEITDINGRKYQVALCRNEFTLLHGHTTNCRGPERRVRLKMATTPGMLGGMLLAAR